MPNPLTMVRPQSGRPQGTLAEGAIERAQRAKFSGANGVSIGALGQCAASGVSITWAPWFFSTLDSP
jgi:hypothetical protein